jgi:hypothetical protein
MAVGDAIAFGEQGFHDFEHNGTIQILKLSCFPTT